MHRPSATVNPKLQITSRAFILLSEEGNYMLEIGPRKPAQRKTEGGRKSDKQSSHEKYFRLVNYLAAAQVYLKDNVLLEQPLKADHIKDRLLGHWGTCPGINFIYLHLNRLILETDASVLLLTGPGHGAAANLANMYIEGIVTEFYPHLTRDKTGLHQFVRAFSWPGGFPSHLNPALPGVIHEGGELGYALATAYGAVLDNPDLIAACIIGDGEAETGPTAAAWHSNKFLNPVSDGAVLPILHLNGYKISSPTIFGTMSDPELLSLFAGYGYAPTIVDIGEDVHDRWFEALRSSYNSIRDIQGQARSGKPPERPAWPMLILRSPKGWTGPREVDNKMSEGSFRSHQVPAKEAKTNAKHLQVLETWLRSYKPEELFDGNGAPLEELVALCPKGERRMAANPHAYGGRIRKPLALPNLFDHNVKIKQRGEASTSSMAELGKYLREVFRRNEAGRNFRIVCPDELESNRLGATLEASKRQYAWPLPKGAENLAPQGRIMEILSEHTCQGWLQGYLLTGRHGLYPCYEAFIAIVDGMMNQYAKLLKSSLEVPWRQPISSLNYLLTSEAWRQDHNGYSHQGPGFINTLLTKKGHIYRIYLPPDANCLLTTIDHCLRSTNYINLVIAGKQPMPQWLTMNEAVEHCRVGGSVWRWASTNEGEDPELVLAACGDNLTMEVMAAASLLRQEAPDWRIRVVNITDLMVLGIPQKYPHGLEEKQFQRLFPLGAPVVFNFHGYTAAIKQLVWERPENERFDINGYREEGTTTTPFDMHILNRTSRFHLVIQAAEKIAMRNPKVAARADELVRKYQTRIGEHREFIQDNGIDPPDITNWRWQS